MTTSTDAAFISNDFNDIMNSLKLFMSTQTEFLDMNFAGSAITELLRVLAFNAQNQSFQNNFMFNELMLDSAQLRNNVASLASSMGYIPSSPQAAKLTVNVVVTPSLANQAPSSLLLPISTQFYTSNNGQSFNFSPATNYTAPLINGVYTFNNVVLLQGTWAVNAFTVDTQYGNDSYIIPNSQIDTTTLQVNVRSSLTSANQVVYNQFKSAYDLGPTALLYFLRETQNGLYGFKFGDGKFANRLSYGNVITARYLVTDGASGNNLSNVAPSTSIGGYYNIVINQVDPLSYGGADQEDIESIRTLAPIAFATANSGVTAADYVGLVSNLFPAAGNTIAWGGQDNNPPKQGYVFIAVEPVGGGVLTPSQKADLVSILQTYNIGSITPIIVDPIYCYINLTTTINYLPSQLAITTDALKQKISDYCGIYSQENMAKFNGSMNMSVLSQFINAIDPAIDGNYTTASYELRFVPNLNSASSYLLEFNHAISAGTVRLDGFTVTDLNNAGMTYYVADDSKGSLSLFKTDGTVITTMVSNLGTVNYNTGEISISGFRPNALLSNGYVRVQGSLLIGDQSIKAINNCILLINDVNVTLSPVANG